MRRPRALCSCFVLGYAGLQQTNRTQTSSMDFWIDLGRAALIGVAVSVAVTAAWIVAARLLAPWDKPRVNSGNAGVIRPWPPLWLLMAVFFALIAAGGAGHAIVNLETQSSRVWMFAIAGFIAVLGWCSLLTALPTARLEWSESGVEGPASQFASTRRRLFWRDIERCGKSAWGYYFLEDRTRQRVFWSWCYIGARHFWRALLQHRPDLAPQVDLAVAADG